MAWYNASWSHRAKITSQSAQVDSAYPYCLAIDLNAHFASETAFWGNLQSTGADVRVTKADETTEVARGVRNVDTSGETGVVYVYHEDISASSNIDLYLYWGNSGASDHADDATYGIENTWNTENILLHLTLDDEDTTSGSGNVEDQSGNSNDGTEQNTPVSSTGQIADARSFQKAEPDWISVPHGTDFEGLTALTLLAWAKPSATSHGGFFARVVSKPNVATSDDYFLGYLPVGGGNYSAALRVTAGGTTGTSIEPASTMTTAAWNFLSGTWDGTTQKLYVNAVERKSETNTGSLQQSSQQFGIGAHPNNAVADSLRAVEGDIDHVRVLGDALTANDISTIYNCENANASFWSRAAVETQGGVFINVPASRASSAITVPVIATGVNVSVPAVAAQSSVTAPTIVTQFTEVLVPASRVASSVTAPTVLVDTGGQPRDRRKPWQKIQHPTARMPARLRR